MQALFSVLALLLSVVAAQDAIPQLKVLDKLDDNAVVNHVWMEIGYATFNDRTWTEVETTVATINADDSKVVSVFISLPEYGGTTYEDGWPMVPKLAGRATKSARGTYKFSGILVQPNDSYCPKAWWTPVHTDPVEVGWMVVEEGVYNVSNTQFLISSGEITRDNGIPVIEEDRDALHHAKHVFNYTTGCDSADPDAVCEFVPQAHTEKANLVNKTWLHLGALQQLQTSVNKVPDDPSKELFLSVRAKNVFTDRIEMMLMTHSVFQREEQWESQKHKFPPGFNFSFYPDYETFDTPEIVSYFIWEKDLRLRCVEGLALETQISVNGISHNVVEMDYFYTYKVVPALFGMLGTLNSVADSTVLRTFDRSLTGSFFVTQEDQCTDSEQKHTTPESAFSFVVGDSNTVGDTECFIVYDKQPCVYDILLVDAFGDGWGNNYFEVDVDGSLLRYDVPCGSQSIQIISTSCEFRAQMQCEGVCTTTWENYWEFSFRSVDYFGDHDSTLHVKDIIVTVTDPVNVDPNANANKCDQCKVAHPPGWVPPDQADGMGDGMGQGDGAGAGAGPGEEAAGPGNTWLLGANVVPADGGNGGGNGGGLGSGSGSSGTLTAFIVGNGLFFSATTAVKTGSAITGVGFNSGAAGVNGDALFNAVPSPDDMEDGDLILNAYGDSFYVNEATIAEILAGNVYCSIFTVDHPNGELRGQVAASVVGTSFNMLGSSVVPSVDTASAGVLSLYRRSINGDDLLFCSVNVGSVEGTVTAVTLNAGGVGAVGGVIYNLEGPYYLGVIALDETFDVAANLNAMYAQVLTEANPNGEVRGDASVGELTASDLTGAPSLDGTANYLIGGNIVPSLVTDSIGVLTVYLAVGGDHIYYHINVANVAGSVNVAYLVAGSASDAFDSSKVIYTFDRPGYGAIPLKYYTMVASNLDAMYVVVMTDEQSLNGEVRGQVSFGSYYEYMMMYGSASADDDASKNNRYPKPKPPAVVPVVIELFEQSFANGWYDDSGAVDLVAPAPMQPVDSAPVGRKLAENITTFPVPRILTYPQYTIANADNTKLIHSGTICPQKGKRASFERCEEPLPANGEFIFRVTGWVPEPEQDSWKFCGVAGSVGQELRFQMVKGKCVPMLPLIDAAELCQDDGGSIVTVIGQVQFDGVVLTEMSQYDMLVFENEIISMMGSVVTVSVNSYTQTSSGLVVTFGASVVAERYNVDVEFVENIAPLVATLKSTLARKLYHHLYLSSNEAILAAGYPRSSLMDAKTATLLSMEYVSVKYVNPLPADKTVDFTAVTAETTSSDSKGFPFALSASVAGAVLFVAFVGMKVRGSRDASSFSSLPTSSEHSVDLSEDRLTPFDLGMEDVEERNVVESLQ